MKVAVLSESPADEAAIRILVEGVLGRETELPPMPPIRSRGHDAVIASLPTVLKHLHYRTDAEALIVVMDSDYSPVHQESHDQPARVDEKCRLCRLRMMITREKTLLAARQPYAPIKIALGLAVPQIEAWYRCGIDPHVSEAAWIQALQYKKYPYEGRRLKRDVYGMERPTPGLAMSVPTEQARRIVDTGELPRLEQLFPGGFGALASDVRSW